VGGLWLWKLDLRQGRVGPRQVDDLDSAHAGSLTQAPRLRQRCITA
jgi:hypothetical protein